MKIISKKLIAHIFLTTIARLWARKKNIVFYAPVKFHALHLLPVIHEMQNNPFFKITLVGCFEDIETLSGLPKFPFLNELPIYNRYDVFIMTEITLPWGLRGKKVFFGHGIGPKLNYQSSSSLNDFESIFVPCLPMYQAQQSLQPTLFKIGLPLLDNPTLSDNQSTNIQKTFKIDSDKPTIVYAPSWSDEEHLISDVELNIERLSSLINFNVIISPHPNLLNPNKFTKSSLFENPVLPLNTPASDISTFELCLLADIVISDISSLLFESMAIDKMVLFDGNHQIYKACGADEVLTNVCNAIPTIDWKLDLENQIALLQDNYDYQKMKSFIQSYLFNQGTATKEFIKSIYKLC